MHWSVGIPTQHSSLLTKPLHCQALLHVQCKNTAMPTCPVKQVPHSWHEPQAKAWGCTNTHLWFIFSSVSFLSFSVVAPDLHLQKWKQKKELSMPVIVCMYRKCLSNIAANVPGHIGPGTSSSRSHLICFIVNICACMHFWMKNVQMYDKTASLVGYLTVFSAKYPFLMQSGSIHILS